MRIRLPRQRPVAPAARAWWRQVTCCSGRITQRFAGAETTRRAPFSDNNYSTKAGGCGGRLTTLGVDTRPRCIRPWCGRGKKRIKQTTVAGVTDERDTVVSRAGYLYAGEEKNYAMCLTTAHILASFADNLDISINILIRLQLLTCIPETLQTRTALVRAYTSATLH